MCHFGGGPIGDSRLKDLKKLLPHTKVSLVYGLTETGGYLTRNCSSNFESMDKKTTSSGVVAPGVAMKVVLFYCIND